MVRLAIAGVVIGLDAEAGGPRAVVDGAAKAFVVDRGTPDITMRATWGDLGPARGELLFDSGGLWQLHRQDGRVVYSFRSASFGPTPYRTASFDPAFKHGIVTLDRASFAGRPTACPLEYPLDELMVINRLVFEEGVEIHGCGVVDSSGAGYLFPGQSGAGKSTIARLWAEAGATVVSDDRVVVRAGPAGLTMHGTPWHGDAEFAAPASARLSRILLLRHGPRHRAVALPAALAAARLFSCAFPVFHDARALDATVALLGRIVDGVPVQTLEFAPVASAIDFVRALAAS